MKSTTLSSAWTKLICIAIASCMTCGWLAAPTRASTIMYTPTGVTASSELPVYPAPRSIDASGLQFAVPATINSVLDLPKHDVNPGRMWLTNDGNGPTATIEFDLGSVVTLDSLYIWNSGETGLTGRGAKNVDVYAGTSPSPATLVQSYVVSQSVISAGLFSVSEYLFPSTITARYVKLDILSNWGDVTPAPGPDGYVGLAEVRFGGLVPEPASLSLLGGGAVAALLRRRRASV